MGKKSNVETVKNICILIEADTFVEKKCIKLSFCTYLSCTYTEKYPHGGNVKLTYRLNMIIKTNLPVTISCQSIYLNAYIMLFLPVPTPQEMSVDIWVPSVDEPVISVSVYCQYRKWHYRISHYNITIVVFSYKTRFF